MAKDEESLFAIDDLDLDIGEANKPSDVNEAEPLQVRKPDILTY